MRGSVAPIVLAAVAASCAAACLVMAAESLRERRHRTSVLRQLRMLASERGAAAVSGGGEPLLRAEGIQSALLHAIATRVPQLRSSAPLLQQAGLDWSEQRFLVSLGVGALAGGVLGSIFGAALATLFGVVAGALLPYLYVRRVRASRMKAFEEQLPEAIDLLGRAIRSGHPLSAGLRMVAEEAGNPVGGEFRRVFEEQKFGLPFEDSLGGLASRVPLVDVRILVTAIMIQREVGGNLAEILDNLSQLIRSRFTIRRQLRTYTAQGRMSGYVMGALPIAVGGLIFLVNPDYMMTLFREPVGRMMLWAAVGLQMIGFFWIRRVVDIEI